MEVGQDKVVVNRLEANTGKELKEPWVIEAPFGSAESLKKYSDSRKDSNKAPSLDANMKVTVSEITDINENKQKMISFKSGSDDDFVHSYRLEFLDENKKAVMFEEIDYDDHIVHYDKDGSKIRFDNKDYENGTAKQISQLTYFSDYVLGLENMSDVTQLRLPSNLPENVKYVSVTAIDSWGAESEAVVCELNV